jgi:hypothetical protein
MPSRLGVKKSFMARKFREKVSPLRRPTVLSITQNAAAPPTI